MCPIHFNNKQTDDVAEGEPVRAQVIKGRVRELWVGRGALQSLQGLIYQGKDVGFQYG